MSVVKQLFVYNYDLMDRLTNLIINEKDSDAVFVFPSEAAAAGRRREFLTVSGKTAVKNSRFISWDRFKEDITLHDRLEKPVNSILRKLFSSNEIRRNTGEQLFSKLVPVEARSGEAFIDLVCRVLPELEKLVRIIKAEPASFDSALAADYIRLYHDYLTFMKTNSLFEPSWDLPDLKHPNSLFYIISPEIIEDFNEYENLLSDAGCRLFKGAEPADEGFSLFENSVIETDTVLNSISSLLAAGMRYTELAVTAADESTADIFLSKARLRGIPVNYRSGKPLSDYPSGRLPELILQCKSSGYSIASMKNLLLYRAFVWKDAETAAALIRFGIENRCLKNTSAAPSGDVWANRLRSIRCRTDVSRDDMLGFYRKLKKGIERVTRAADFNELAREFQVFVSTFLDTAAENWDSECEQVFQRTREVLSSLRETGESLKDIVVTDPLGLWIELLKEKIYVQQQSERGIAMFPYRVSALINPAHHFIIGLSHEASTAVSTAFSFLTDQQRRDVDAAELNMTGDFIKIYSCSGRTVHFSCATDTSTGAALPPGFFIESGKISRIQSFAMDDELTDPVQAENRWWRKACRAGFKINEAGKLPILSGKQLTGFEYAAASFMTEKGFDAAGQCFPEDFTASKLLATSLNKDSGFFRVSATRLNRWTDCRFNMLLTDLLGIYDEEYTLLPEDPWSAGNVMHEILKDFFQTIQDSGSSFRLAGNSGAYKDMIKVSAERVFLEWEKGQNYFFGPAWDSLKRRALQDLLLFPEAEAEYFDGLSPEFIEDRLAFTLDEEQIEVIGNVDRISTGGQGSVIVDYKKTWKKQTKQKFISEDGQGGLLPPQIGYQLPIYILLAERNGLKAAASSYYSISGAAHYPVTGDFGVLGEEEQQQLCELTLKEIVRMAKESRQGNFTAPDRCGGCSFRAICRKRFSVRWINR